IPALARDVSYRIDGPHAWAQISQPGEYRAAIIQNAGASELEFAVLRGSAELTNEGGRTTLRAGERAFARADAAPSHPYVFNSASWDPFDRWSEARRSERLGVSTQYLPPEVRSYAGTVGRLDPRLVVLDPRARVVAGVGFVGTCAWLRELVPAGLQ